MDLLRNIQSDSTLPLARRPPTDQFGDPLGAAYRAVKSRVGHLDLKSAIDRASIQEYVARLLEPWWYKNRPDRVKALITEVRAYRRDHQFFDCV